MSIFRKNKIYSKFKQLEKNWEQTTKVIISKVLEKLFIEREKCQVHNKIRSTSCIR